ncbi:unnamed protein product [Leptidea sinapis]|uniref:Odorant receptor n=1 Tax=Leptidea sinapis TaxID=189913 RepID=A0A5E4Q3A8_9NEOP|nr:unnamed protein product [Leptidea sinapis]
MLNRILAKLEDSQRPLLGPNYSALRFWGLLLPEKITKRIFYLFMHFLVTFFTATEYVDIWFVKDDINLLLNNIKITFLATVSVAKVITFLSRQKDWKAIIEYVNNADLAQRGSNNVRKNIIIWKYTKYCRKITYLYWSLMYTTVIIVMGQPMFKFFCSEEYRNNVQNGTETYVQVVSSWVPFDKNTVAGHIAASIFQSYAAIYGGGWITSFDTNAIVIMVFFKAELEMLRIDSSRLFGDNGDSLNEEDTVKILKDCHRRHVELLRKRIIRRNLDENSKYLMLGPYESGWWLQNAAKQKHIIILADQFNKNIVFTAGPFNDLSVSTFINSRYLTCLKWILNEVK